MISTHSHYYRASITHHTLYRLNLVLCRTLYRMMMVGLSFGLLVRTNVIWRFVNVDKAHRWTRQRRRRPTDIVWFLRSLCTSVVTVYTIDISFSLIFISFTHFLYNSILIHAYTNKNFNKYTHAHIQIRDTRNVTFDWSQATFFFLLFFHCVYYCLYFHATQTNRTINICIYI